MTRSRNHFTAVPQAPTPSHCGVFRVFFTLFLTFRTFSLEIPTFSPKRGNGNACPLFFPAPSGFEATFAIIVAGLRWTYGALVLQPKKTLKNFAVFFWKIPVSFAQKRSIGCRYIVKKCD